MKLKFKIMCCLLFNLVYSEQPTQVSQGLGESIIKQKNFEKLRDSALSLSKDQINRVLHLNNKINKEVESNNILFLGINKIIPLKKNAAVIYNNSNTEFDDGTGMLFKPGYAQLGTVFGVRNSCINESVSKTNFSEYETTISITNEQAKSQQEKMLAIRTSLRVGVGAFSADNNLEFQNQSMFDKTRITYKYENAFIGEYKAMVDGENLFTTFANDFYKNNKMAFMLDCGNSFVYKEKAGAKIIGYLSIDISNISNSSTLTNNFKASYSTLAEVSSSVNNANKDSSNNLSMSTKFIQQGGEPLALATVLENNKCNANNLDGCTELFNKINKYSVDDFRLQLCKDGIEVNAVGKFVCKGNKIDKNRLRYFSPVLAKYLDVKPSLILDNKDETQSNKEAITKLEKLFETTLLIRYKLEELEQKLNIPELVADLQKFVLEPVRARQVYLLTVGSLCYNGSNSCEIVMESIHNDFNLIDKYKIDIDRLEFYLTDYKIQNYLNMANSAGLSLNNKNIEEVEFQPVGYKDYMYTYKYQICNDYICKPFSTFIYFDKYIKNNSFNLVIDGLKLPTKCLNAKYGNNYECTVNIPNTDVIWKSIVTPTSIFSSHVINEYANP